MQALNFLNEKPLVNWFDYTLHPEKLECPGPNEYQPKHEDLLFEFVEQAQREEIISTEKNATLDDVAYHQRKALGLWRLAFRIAGRLNWNLRKIRSILPSVSGEALIEALVKLCFGVPSVPSLEELGDVQALSPQSFFSLILYTRWHLVAATHDSMVNFGEKLAVTVPSNVNDPVYQTLLERHRLVAEQSRRRLTASVGFLQTLCVSDSVPTFVCLLPESIDTNRTTFSTDFSQCRSIEWNQLVLQLNYDLAVYHFTVKKYSVARQHFSNTLDMLSNKDIVADIHLDFDISLLKSFCSALAITEESTSVVETHNSMKCAALSAPEKSELDRRSNLLRVLHRIRQRRPVSEADCSVLVDSPHEVVAILQATTSREKSAVEASLSYMVSRHPLLLAACTPIRQLVNHRSKADHTSSPPPKETSLAALYANGLMKANGPRTMLLTSYDFNEIKRTASQLQFAWVTTQWRAPMSLAQVISNVPRGFLQDLIVSCSAKASQLADLQMGNESSAMLASLLSEFRLSRAPPEIADSMSLALTWESISNRIRIFLNEFTDLTHTAASLFADELKTLISQFAKSHQQSSIPVNTTLIQAFIYMLNCPNKLEFLITTCKNLAQDSSATGFVGRLSHVVVVLSLVLYNMQRSAAGSDLNVAVREFFDILNGILRDVARKDASGELLKYEDACNGLLSRSQLAELVSSVRHPSLISMLLSILIRFYTANEMTTIPVRVEYESVLTAVDVPDPSALNADCIKELIDILASTAMRIDSSKTEWLRMVGDYCMIRTQHHRAMRYYIELLYHNTCGFTSDLAALDGTTIERMISAASELKAHTLAAVLVPLHPSPDYGQAVRSIEASVQQGSYDASTELFPLVFDQTLMEYFMNAFSRFGHYGKMELALRRIQRPELGGNNRADVGEETRNRCTQRLLQSIMRQYCR